MAAGVRFNPIFLNNSQNCGICQESIEKFSLAHGHVWTIEGDPTKIYDVFHRSCITQHDDQTCPNCNSIIINKNDYLTPICERLENIVWFQEMQFQLSRAVLHHKHALPDLLKSNTPYPFQLLMPLRFAAAGRDIASVKIILNYLCDFYLAAQQNEELKVFLQSKLLFTSLKDIFDSEILDFVVEKFDLLFANADNPMEILEVLLLESLKKGNENTVELICKHPNLFKNLSPVRGSSNLFEDILCCAAQKGSYKVIATAFEAGATFSPQALRNAYAAAKNFPEVESLIFEALKAMATPQSFY